MRAVDYDLLKSQERSTELGKLAEAKDFELRRASDALDAAQGDLLRFKDEAQRL